MIRADLNRTALGLLASVMLGFTALVYAKPPPIADEPIGIVETLPSTYPPSWFLVQDAAFFHMGDGKVYVIDTMAETLAAQVKGTFNVSLIGNLTQSAKRSEMYVTETFHTRGSRGDRMDFVTIYDQSTLAPKGEVSLPVGKRFMGMPQRYALLVLNDDKWLAVANFSPGTSVTLIDLDTREIIDEIPTLGCVLSYPTGKRGLSSLCADGRLLSTELAADGSITAQTRSDVFFNSDDSPISERPVVLGDAAYFPSLAGLIYPVDISGPTATVGEPWNLVPEAERAEGWLPAGIGLIDGDDQGHFYIIMHPDGHEDTYQGGGPEVWVYDAAEKKRVNRIVLQTWGLSLAVSRGDDPLLMVVNPTDMSLEMYKANSGEFIRTITDFGQETPLMVQASK
ncbi:MAG: amine dehydrogenase large subunit [Pseudomonadota bacterium]